MFDRRRLEYEQEVDRSTDVVGFPLEVYHDIHWRY